MIIKIDVRETELIQIVRNLINNIPSFKELKVITENLPLGDIIISINNQDKLIIERKYKLFYIKYIKLILFYMRFVILSTICYFTI